MVEVDQTDGRVLAVGTERHGLLPGEPCHELFIHGNWVRGTPCRDQKRAQHVNYLISFTRVRGDLGVQSDQGCRDEPFEEHLVGTAREFATRQELYVG